MNSYKDIAKSSGIIALVQIIRIIFGLIQNKVLALIVGTSGFGIWGMYNTYLEMISSFSFLGLDASGVREIAKNSDNRILTSKCIWIFKKSLLLISLIATVLSMIFAKYISVSLFKTTEYTWEIVAISLVIFFNGIAKGNIAILNGLRHIKYLAISQIIGAIIGAITAIIFVLFLGVKGIPLFLISIGFTLAFTTWLYTNKLRIQIIKPTFTEIKSELKILITMGLGFSISGALSALMAYLSRIYLISEFDMDAVGIYQASWTISNIYVGTILTAMGVDFMPRIMKVIGNKYEMDSMVTEQLEFGILVSSIGVLIILIFSPLILHLFYSNEFIIGTSIIRWQVLGVAMRVFGFVFGYVIMAHNRPVTFILTQALVVTLDYIFLIIFAKLLGFSGLGINYFLSYFIYLLVTYPICYKLFDINFSKVLIKIIIVEWIFITIILIMIALLNNTQTMIIGSLLILSYLYWVNYAFNNYLKINAMEVIKQKLIKKR